MRMRSIEWMRTPHSDPCHIKGTVRALCPHPGAPSRGLCPSPNGPLAMCPADTRRDSGELRAMTPTGDVMLPTGRSTVSVFVEDF